MSCESVPAVAGSMNHATKVNKNPTSFFLMRSLIHEPKIKEPKKTYGKQTGYFLIKAGLAEVVARPFA